MTVSDNLGDALIQVKNGYMAGRSRVQLAFSKEKENALKVLAKNKIIESLAVEMIDEVKRIVVMLPPKTKNLSIKRMSKPGRRMYVKTTDLYTLKGGRGFLLVSTSQGIMDGKQAQEKKLGGELIAEVY